jgi:putative FmdB family regulatory protein
VELRMPIYEYICARCSRKFDLLVRSGREKARCPHCGARKARKQFSVFGMSTGGRPAPSGG